MRTGYLALLLLAAAAAATAVSCPAGMSPVTRRNWAQAKLLGTDAFRQAAYKANKGFPIFIEDDGLKRWKVSIVPVCAGKGVYTYNVASLAPLSGRQLRGTQMLDTRPLSEKDWVEMIKLYQGTTITKDWRQMRPMECPAGYFKAQTEAQKTLVSKFLLDSLRTQKVMLPLFQAKNIKYCTLGFTSYTVDPKSVSGCIGMWPRYAVMGEGKLTYTCWGSKNVHVIGMIVSGEYEMDTTWDIQVKFT